MLAVNCHCKEKTIFTLLLACYITGKCMFDYSIQLDMLQKNVLLAVSQSCFRGRNI